MAEYNPLTKQQEKVLLEGATEAPFTGQHLYESRDGRFLCARCDNPLFDSHTKFESGCGWPSFDQAIEGSVIEKPDNSLGMVRTEIVCANCGGHLGHVFDDGPADTTGMRYCINSLSLNFDQSDDTD